MPPLSSVASFLVCDLALDDGVLLALKQLQLQGTWSSLLALQHPPLVHSARDQLKNEFCPPRVPPDPWEPQGGS